MLKRFYIVGMLALTLLIAVGCGSKSDGESSGGTDTLTVVDWGGAVTEARQDTIFKPFEEEHNVKIEVESPTDYGKLKAMVDGGNTTWDVVNVDTFWAETAGTDGLLEPIDYDIVSKDNIIPELATEYSMGAEMYSTVIAYNTEENPDGDHPENWEEFWDVEKYPGARALYNDPLETIEIALLADGVDPDDLYPLDIDRAFDSLEKLEESTEVVWWDAGAEPVELLSTGTVAYSAAWNGRITDAQADGVPVDLEYNQATLSSESWAVPKDSKNQELAMEFIEFASSAEVQAAFAETIDYSPVNEEAIEMLPDEVRERLGQSPELAESQVLVDTSYWANQQYEEVTQRMQEWHMK